MLFCGVEPARRIERAEVDLIGVVTTVPGSVSQKGMQRRGFPLLFTRAILVHDAGEY